MAELYARRGTDPEAMYQRMKGLMDAEGLPYGRRTHTYNSRLAQELGKWADTQPGGGAIHDKLYQAYFVDAKNIGDIDVLVGIAASVGLPAEEARAVLVERRLKDEVDALEEKVDPQTWDAIDSVRKIGNVGAHMEADINVIVDVDPDEATLLISLIETLLADWYISRHNREERMFKIKAISEEKQRERDGDVGAASESNPPPTIA